MKKSLLILLAAFWFVFPTHAQTTEGKEFWLTFGKNHIHTSPALLSLQIRIVGGSEQTTGTIYFKNINTTINFDIAPYEIYNHYLTPTQASAVYNTVTGVSNFSVHIVASNPVTVYAYNGITAGSFSLSDATNVLPVETLGTDYYQISYRKTYNFEIVGDAYAVVATQNNTQIFHDGVSAGVLNAGWVYYRVFNPDMTGNRITSTKPVAFFAVNHGASVPVASSAESPLFQQLAPVNTWGRNFLVPAVVVNRVRIVAAHNGTDITQTGGTICNVPGAQLSLTNLQAGQFVELDFDIYSSNGCHIQTNRPVGVCAYFTQPIGQMPCPGSCPSQCWIPVIEQKIVSVKLAPFITNPPAPMYHYALIVTPTDNKDNTKVSIGGGAATYLSGGTWIDNIASGMSFYSMPLTNETQPYVFTNSKGLIIYGYGCNYTALGSYYYLAGSAMRDLDAAFYANDIHFQDLKENPFCEGLVDFRAEINGLHPTHPERLTWWIDGVEYLPAKNLEQWSKTFSVGEYEIEMRVRYENDEIAVKTGTLIIVPCNYEAEFFANDIPSALLQNNTICNKTGKVDFRAEIEGLSQEPGSLKWFIDYGSGEIEETSYENQLSWSKNFDTGTYPIRMWVLYANGVEENVTATLKVEIFWIKMQNVRH